MTILKEDYMRWCDECKQTGRIKILHEKEMWGGKVSGFEHKICPKCIGTKIYLDMDEYVAALEHRIKELEEFEEE